MLERKILVMIKKKLNSLITIAIIAAFLCAFTVGNIKLANFTAQNTTMAEVQKYKDQCQTLTIELREYKKAYEKVVKIRDRYRTSIKEIVELLYNKDSYLGVGTLELHDIPVSDEVTLLTVRNIVASMEDDQQLLAEVKNYLSARKEFIDSFPFAWPVYADGALDIVSGFGFRKNVFDRNQIHFHQGIDIGGGKGALILATAAGKVTSIGIGDIAGKYIVIEHKNGFTTHYGHLDDIKVKMNQEISRGETIGTMGNTGLSTGIHLHYEIRINGTPIDPLNFLTMNY